MTGAVNHTNASLAGLAATERDRRRARLARDADPTRGREPDQVELGAIAPVSEAAAAQVVGDATSPEHTAPPTRHDGEHGDEASPHRSIDLSA